MTHPGATRIFRGIPKVGELVLQAGAIGDPGDVPVLDMDKPVRNVDVARRLIAEAKARVETTCSGLQPGTRLNKVLFSAEDDGSLSSHPLITRVGVASVDPDDIVGEHDSADGGGQSWLREPEAGDSLARNTTPERGVA